MQPNLCLFLHVCTLLTEHPDLRNVSGWRSIRIKTLSSSLPLTPLLFLSLPFPLFNQTSGGRSRSTQSRFDSPRARRHWSSSSVSAVCICLLNAGYSHHGLGLGVASQQWARYSDSWSLGHELIS